MKGNIKPKNLSVIHGQKRARGNMTICHSVAVSKRKRKNGASNVMTEEEDD
jgi:hypothetical protein